jgi:hypothetical protein
MKNKFKLTVNGLPASLEIFQFSGGEIQVKVGNPSTSKNYNDVELFALVRDGDIMSLALIKDAIDRAMPNSKVHLKLPYLPYARQDRVMNNGESLAVAVFCKVLNALRFESVTVTDCHSDVGLALINNVTNIIEIPEFKEFYDCIVSPDAGEYGKLGISICYDTYSTPELERYYSAMGCNILINPTATGGGWSQSNMSAWEEYYKVRLESIASRDGFLILSSDLVGMNETPSNPSKFPGGSINMKVR